MIFSILILLAIMGFVSWMFRWGLRRELRKRGLVLVLLAYSFLSNGQDVAPNRRRDFQSGICGLTNNIAVYWPFDQAYTDKFNGIVLTPQSGPTFPTYPLANMYMGFGSLSSDPNGFAQVTDAIAGSTIGMGGTVSFTISFWVWSQFALAAAAAYIDKGTAYDGVHDTYLVGNDSGSPIRYRFFIGDGAGGHSAFVLATNGNSNANTWHHIASVYDAAKQVIRITVDGTTNTPVAWTFGTVRNAANFSVLANTAGAFNQKAAMDELIIWTNRALSEKEVATVYTNGLLALTPLTYCSGINARYTVYFNGDSRFGNTGSTNTIPQYFQHASPPNSTAFLSWAPLPAACWCSNHNATVVNIGGGTPPPSPPNLQQIDDWTNAALHYAFDSSGFWLTNITNYYGVGTNLYYIPQNGINNIFIMMGAPLYGYWTHTTIATIFTNWLNYVQVKFPNIKIVSTTIIPQIGLEANAGDGSGQTQEQVRFFVDQAITNQFPILLGGLYADPFSPTNNVPAYWTPNNNVSEFNDIGCTNYAAHLNALFNSLVP